MKKSTKKETVELLNDILSSNLSKHMNEHFRKRIEDCISSIEEIQIANNDCKCADLIKTVKNSLDNGGREWNGCEYRHNSINVNECIKISKAYDKYLKSNKSSRS